MPSTTPGTPPTPRLVTITDEADYLTLDKPTTAVPEPLYLHGIAVPDEFRDIAGICTATEVKIGGQVVLGVADHRALHTALLVGRDHTNWIKGRIDEYGFVEGRDFEIGSPDRANQTGRGGDRRSVIYRLSLPMAKEIAMVEANERGRLVRRFYLWIENTVFAAPDQSAGADEIAVRKARTAELNAATRALGEIRRTAGPRTACGAAVKIFARIGVPLDMTVSQTLAQGELNLGKEG